MNVSDDPSSATKIHSNIAVDPTTGVVAISWQDARGSADDTEVNEYGVFLDPWELKAEIGEAPQHRESAPMGPERRIESVPPPARQSGGDRAVRIRG